MKTTRLKNWMAVCAAALTVTAGYRVLADEAAANAPVAKPDKTYTGTVVSVDPKESQLDVNGFLFSHKQFNLGDTCTYMIVGQASGAVDDLRPGQRVTVGYQDANGVLVADRVTQQPLRDEGMVKAIDAKAQTLTLHAGMIDKTFQLPPDCAVSLRGDKTGTLGDIQAGDHVTVTYEVPEGKATVRELAQNSATFTGDLTAIDLDQKTIKAKATFSVKKFNVGDDCAIMVNGRPDGKLTDLRPGESLAINYDEVNGVNIINRIAPGGDRRSSVASSAPTQMGY
jgi:Cu/Ag efflux protein CusF